MEKIIYSIESISDESVAKIKKSLNCEYCYIDRKDFLQKADVHRNVSVLICRDRDKVSEIVDVCPNLKMLSIVSTGVEKLPFDKLKERAIVVSNTGGLNAPIMSEYAMAYILSQSARVCENLLNQTKHVWKKFQCVDTLNEKTLLIVGAGRTGQLLAKKAKVFGMQVLGIKKQVSKLANFDAIDNLENLDIHLKNADYVVVTMPLTPETRNLFDANRFKQMKKESVFINISRAGLVKQEALLDALKNGIIGCAILDVFEQEPISSSSELWDVDNLYITPHSSGRLPNFVDEAVQYCIDNIKAFWNETPLPNRVNLDAGY